MRALIPALFMLGVAATVLAGDGVILVPHTHAPGTPAEHPHGLALYRFPIALLGMPADASATAARTDRQTSFRMAAPLTETLAGATLLLIAALVIVLTSAPRRITRLLRSLVAIDARWTAIVPTGPPRLRPIV